MDSIKEWHFASFKGTYLYKALIYKLMLMSDKYFYVFKWRGYWTPTQTIACFVLFLKIMNTF